MMGTTPQMQRGLLLMEQGRHEMAEQEMRQHLVQEPNDGFAHALLALCLLEQKRLKEAEEASHSAIGSEPDSAFSHYALARVLSERNRDDEALHAIEEAIRLDPTDADYHGMRGAIHFDRRNWQLALEAAERGLQFEPENKMCNNLRAMALVKLGRREEAGITIERTLARDPDDAFSHANQGWTLLHARKPKEAMHHFRESLRLDPTNDWAKAGLVEALKASNFIYAWMLRYFLWMNSLSSGARWGIIVGGYFGSRMLKSVAKANPALAPWVFPLQLLYIVFAVMTWLAAPIFNLLLFLHPLGRHALGPDQKAQASWVGACLAVAFGAVAAFFLVQHNIGLLLLAVVAGLITLPLSAVFVCDKGWPRWAMWAITGVLAAFGLAMVTIAGVYQPQDNTPLAQAGETSGTFFFIGIFISQWVANWLMTQKPRR
jgi:tetratricopeptide (TPR) repeat protein